MISDAVEQRTNTLHTVAREHLTEKGSSEQSPKGNKEGKSIPDSGKSKGKDPKAEVCLANWKKSRSQCGCGSLKEEQ